MMNYGIYLLPSFGIATKEMFEQIFSVYSAIEFGRYQALSLKPNASILELTSMTNLGDECQKKSFPITSHFNKTEQEVT